MMSKNDKRKKVQRTLRDDDILITAMPSRRSALSIIGAGITGASGFVLGVRKASAQPSDPGDTDTTIVSDYKFVDGDQSISGADQKPAARDYSDLSDLADTDENRVADSKAVDTDQRRIADTQDTD